MKLRWQRLLVPERLCVPQSASAHRDELAPDIYESGRSQFQKDYDRIVFSPAFRRLARKTQVHPLSSNDHVHTRLIHSLEVASVGRSLGVQAGAHLCAHDVLPKPLTPEDVGVIVQSACLAHDIGNPPFGHTGEDAVRDWFCDPNHWHYLDPLPELAQVADFQNFEGNAQGFRLVARLEKHLDAGGLRLTLPTLGAMLKYPWLSCERGGRAKFGCFYSERQLLDTVADRLGLLPIPNAGYQRHPLVYLVEAADDICYRILDLEDAVELNILPYTRYANMVAPLVGRERLNEAAYARSVKDRLALLRGPLFERLVEHGATLFAEQLETLTLDSDHPGLLSISTESDVAEFMSAAKVVAETEIFKNRPKTEIEVGVYATMGGLLSVFMSAAYAWHAQDGNGVGRRVLCINDLLGSQAFTPSDDLYASYLKVMDFLSGMTDFHASRLAQRLSGMLSLR
ncbi:MAG: deoxyguanosinetriphosphate triphosphohydrolase [Gammaproteobacteria bacterium]